MNFDKLMGLIGPITGLMSNPWALVGGLAFIGVAWFYFVNKGNKMVDDRDRARGGAEVGEGAVDLRNQANTLKDFGNAMEEQVRAEGPPKEGE